MRLRWLPEAWEDIQRMFDFLADTNPVAAGQAMDLIMGGADRLLDMSEIGAPMGDDSHRRELHLPFGAGAYVLRHRLDDDCVVIIRVWHSREHRE